MLSNMNAATSSEDSDLPLSENITFLLPGYEILRLIAQGGMGAVYLARQKSLDREVAIKILPRELSQDEEFRASFETEAKCMARLNHPNLIGVYDFGETDGLLYIIMELVQGQSLYHLIQQGGISPAEALRLTAGVCHGLASAHALGILHRDIKPANILLDETGSPKIVDFGLARPVGAHERDACFGTPGYTAPEVVRDPKGVSERTDIFSVGVMLYEMVTGALPPESYVPAALRVDCHTGFDRVITRAIHQSPLLRYGSANEMAEALAKLADEMAAPSVRLVTQPVLHRTGPLGQVPMSHLVERQHRSAPPVVASDSGHPVRKLFIIAGLVLAIALTWQSLKKAKALRAEEQAAIEARELAEEAREEEAEREALERRKQAAADKAEQARREAEAQALAAKANAEPPMIALERLQSALAGGARDQLPPGTVTTADRAQLLVPEPMTWHQARRFCEEHGGSLAVLPDPGDLTRLGAALKSGEDAWVGGGTDGIGGWCWIDSTAWQHEFRKPVGPSYLALRELGIFKAAAAAEKRWFFIEWAMNGSNPGSMREEFQRCARSHSTPTKLYPAGCTDYHGGRYLLLEADTTWEQAAKLADSAGGKLAVPSTREENEWLFQLHAIALGKEIPCWLGGLRGNAGAWHWANGEPWAFATWIQGNPNEPSGKHCGCAIVSGAWDDFPQETTNPALIIEWSATTGSAPVAATPLAGDGLVKKRTTCKELVTAIQQRYDKAFATNLSAYQQRIDTQLRKLPTRAREAAAASRLIMTSYITEGRIPSNIPRDSLSPELTVVLETHLARQTEQDTAYQAELFSLAAKYRRSLQEEAARLKQQGQGTLQQEVEAEIQAVSGGPKEFYTHITGVPYPDGLSPTIETAVDKLGVGKKWQITSSGNQPGGEPQKAIDGDIESHWHTPWDTSTKENRHPHTLDIDFERVISITGLKLTARSTGFNGRIKDFVIWSRAEGGDWKQVKKGDLPDTAEPQTVRFPTRLSTRHLRIESLSSHHGDYTSLAEVGVIY